MVDGAVLNPTWGQTSMAKTAKGFQGLGVTTLLLVVLSDCAALLGGWLYACACVQS